MSLQSIIIVAQFDASGQAQIKMLDVWPTLEVKCLQLATINLLQHQKQFNSEYDISIVNYHVSPICCLLLPYMKLDNTNQHFATRRMRFCA